MAAAAATATNPNNQTTLQLTGMTCAACANKIEKGLGKLEGVASANVNFALEKASVTYDPAKVDVQRLEETIKKLGYGTVKEVVDFKLEGMTCAACANKIEKGLSKLPGVTNASVNFAMETARVEYNAADVSIAEMQQRVEKLGYKAISKQRQPILRSIARRPFRSKRVNCLSRPYFRCRCSGPWSATFHSCPGFGCRIYS